MFCPKTEEDWWDLVDVNWPDLKKIAMFYYPKLEGFPEMGHPLPKGGLADVQKVCNDIIVELREKGLIWDRASFDARIELLKKERDAELAEVFEESWLGMPEVPEIRGVPGFGVFCDLCSEAYLLEEGFDERCL